MKIANCRVPRREGGTGGAQHPHTGFLVQPSPEGLVALETLIILCAANRLHATSIPDQLSRKV
jgi:hypothetical protein